MNNIGKPAQNLFIYRLVVIKLAVKKMQSAKFHMILIFLAVLVGSFGLSPAISSLMNYVTIESRGRIALEGSVVTANSGSANDIQLAVDQVATAGGGTVYVPEGEWNFVEVGEPWQTVNIPAGVNVLGAPTVRDENDQVTEWKTVLQMPYDIPSNSIWFRIVGSSNPNQPARFSDIKLVGYRSINPSSTTLHTAIYVLDVIDFRIDHSCFEHTTLGITIWGLQCRGVIDHCRLYNIYGFDVLTQYTRSNILYGVQLHRGYWSTGFDPTMSVLGQYTDYTVFIEDCYFSRWRHCVAGAHGSHYVFRYNTIDDDFGHFSLDVHGMRDTGSDRWGGRGAEIYENRFINAIPDDFKTIFQNGGGCGVWFNNYIDNSYRSDGIVLYPEDYVPSSTWHLQDFYLWSKLGAWNPDWDGIPDGFTADRNVLADWSRSAGNRGDPNYPNVDPSWSIAGYTPYPYPHPLTLEAGS